MFEYVDTDKENAYTKIKWANLLFITKLDRIDRYRVAKKGFGRDKND